MSEKPAIAKLSATVDIGYGVETLSVNIGVNAAPSATLNLGQKQGKEQVVVKALTSDVLAEIKKYQDDRLKGVTEPNINIEANDVIYGKFKMRGFVAAPMLEISTASIALQMSVLDEVSLLDGLDLSIYQHVVTMEKDGDLNGVRGSENGSPLPLAKGGDVCKLLLDLTDFLVSHYGNAFEKETDPVRKEIIRMRHELNQQGPLRIWRKILTDSKVVHASWEKMQKLNNNGALGISRKTLNTMTTTSSGFWNILNQLMSAFQMFYRPNPTGDAGGNAYGVLVNNKFKVDEVSGSMDLSVINLNVRDGSARILQVGGVTMEAGSAPGLRNAELAKPTPSIAGVFPLPLLNGYIHQEIPPIWLVDANGVPLIGSDLDKLKDTPPGSEGPKLDLAAYPGRREGGQEYLKKFEAARGGVLTELCEAMFKELQLADSSISARVPLQFGIQVGVRQTIKIGDAGQVEGFVAGVTHQIDLRAGKEMDSFSQVAITHVKY